MADTPDMMAVTLTQASIDLNHIGLVEVTLLEAGYDAGEIAEHAREAAVIAAALRRSNAVCAGLAGGTR